MPQDKLSMHKIRNVLRYRFDAQLSLKATAFAGSATTLVIAKQHGLHETQ
jgi:hypothetical protein